MATMPMQAQPADAENQADAMAPGEESDGVAARFVIDKMTDGSYRAYQGVGEDETGEQSAQTVGSLGQALSLVIKMDKAMSQGDEQSQLQAGFGE